ncbi:MAG: PLP-dependent transferase, partial [Pseudohongiellaceae bacterium]
IERHNANAMKVAEFLAADNRITDVFYPGLVSHKHHDVARKQMRGFGGMLSFSLPGGYESVKTFLPKLKYAHRAAHLGSVDTTAGPPRVTSHVENTPEERKQLGIPEGLIRYSPGIENIEDLIADLDQALGATSKR